MNPQNSTDPNMAPQKHQGMDPLRPDVYGFKDLFLESRDSNSEWGIPFGQTILISGRPGAGKTTFALALVRDLMKKRAPEEQPRPAEAQLRNRKSITYYISSETNLERLRAMFKQFGWFDRDDSGEQIFKTDSKDPDGNTFYAIVPEPEVDRPVPTPEELVNSVFNRIAKTLSPGEAPQEDCLIYVIVDSVTALLKSCASQSDERRHTHEILYRLKELFDRNHLALTVLLAENDNVKETGYYTSSVEDYLAEFVFRLDLKIVPLGRRLRTLEIVKCQGVDMILGEHTWHIITNQTYQRIMRTLRLADTIKKQGQESPDKKNRAPLITQELRYEIEKPWATIAIFPRPRLNHVVQEKHPQTKPNSTPISAGSPELDELLGLGRNNTPPLAGTRTLLAGPIGSGKTTLCLQFLFAAVTDLPGQDHYLVTFEKSLPAILEAWQQWTTHGRTNERRTPSDPPRFEKLPDNLFVIDFTQPQFDFNLIVSHVRWAMTAGEQTHQERAHTPGSDTSGTQTHPNPTTNPTNPETSPGKRDIGSIVFDGLSEWLDLYERTEAAQMLEALMGVVAVREEQPPPTVFFTYDLSPPDDPLAPSILNLNADNVLVLRQTHINDRIHRIIYPIKSISHTCEPKVRELLSKDGFVTVGTGLDSYTGLLSGRPRPAEILLEMFQENEPEKHFNKKAFAKLSALKNLRFKLLEFGRTEISRTLVNRASITRVPPAEVKILSVDEWWRPEPSQMLCLHRTPLPLTDGDLQQPQTPLNATPIASTSDSKTQTNPFTDNFWNQFWFFEVDKTITKEDAELRYAVPAYMDFGLFCLNLEVARRIPHTPADYTYSPESQGALRAIAMAAHRCSDTTHKLPEATALTELRSAWGFILKQLPREWGEPNKRGPLTISLLMADFVTTLGNAPPNETFWGFSFDSSTRETCVCVFFELCWAFGAKENFLHDSKSCDNSTSTIQNVLLFLTNLVFMGLMPQSPTLDTCAKSLFSRHFYSTLRASRGDAREFSKNAPGCLSTFLALPFFPSGQAPTSQDSKTERSLIEDIHDRLKIFSQRLKRILSQTTDEPRSTINDLQQHAERAAQQHSQTTLSLIQWTKDCQPIFDKGLWLIGDPHRADILELWRFHILRMRMLLGSKEPSRLDTVVEDFRSNSTSLSKDPEQGHSVPAGYCASGSWMYGITRPSSSSRLACDLLQELVSFEMAEERASLGAGLPARKDFLQFHGNEPVPGMEQMTWEDFLRFTGSRARRRERVLPDKPKVIEVYEIIHRSVLDCLATAALLRAQQTPNLAASDSLKYLAIRATNHIVTAAKALHTPPAIPSPINNLAANATS